MWLNIAEPLVNRFQIRRKSVFAETYDPENDPDEDEGAQAVFPKTDEQRARLVESVRNILLFRALDKEQVHFQWPISPAYNYQALTLLPFLS